MKTSTKVALASIFGSAACIAFLWNSITATHSDHEVVFHQVALGASVSDLRAVWNTNRERIAGSEVDQWIPTAKHDPRNYGKLDGSTISTEYGIFKLKVLGDFDEWDPTPDEESEFTGQVEFFIHRAFADRAGVFFTIVDGRVVDKGWRFFP